MKKHQNRQILNESEDSVSNNRKAKTPKSAKTISDCSSELTMLLSEGIFDRGLAKVHGTVAGVAQAGKNIMGNPLDQRRVQDAARAKQAAVLFDRFKSDMMKLISSMQSDFGRFENINLQRIPTRLNSTVKKLGLTGNS